MRFIAVVLVCILFFEVYASKRCYKVNTIDLPKNICIDCVYSRKLSGPLMCGYVCNEIDDTNNFIKNNLIINDATTYVTPTLIKVLYLS